MPTQDRFFSNLAELIRRMPDDALLELVGAKLDQGGFVSASQGGRRTSASGASGLEASVPRRGPGRPPKAGGAVKAGRGGARKRMPSAEKEALLSRVEEFVKSSSGVGVRDVVQELRIPKPQAAAALKQLKTEKRIFQGGDRRFARYGGTKEAALQASDAARTSGGGAAEGGGEAPTSKRRRVAKKPVAARAARVAKKTSKKAGRSASKKGAKKSKKSA